METRRVRFSFEVTVPASDRTVALWIPYPVEDAWQRVLGEERPAGFERATDTATGNAMLHAQLPPGDAARWIEVAFVVERRARHHERPDVARYAIAPAQDARFRDFLGSSTRVRVDGANAERAREVTSPDQPPLAIARAIYDHLLATLSYDAGGCTPARSHALGNLEAACDLRTGTCTEFHGLFVAYARALGVPARFTFGFNVPRAAREGAIAGYHCWAEIALPDGTWFPVDVSEAWKRRDDLELYFGGLDPHRIAFATGRDVVLAPPQAGAALDRFIFPYAECDRTEVTTGLAFRFSDV